MSSESPSSKKRKVLQPTIKCFMNSKPSEEGEKGSDAKPTNARGRAAPRSRTPKSAFRDQPPIDIFMRTEKVAKDSVQDENSSGSASTDENGHTAKQPPSSSTNE